MEFESVLTTILTNGNDCEISSSLESLLNYLDQDKGLTTTKILTHPGSEDLLSRLIKLLSSTDIRTSGNAAYIFGILAETEQGFERIYSIGNKTSSLESVDSCTTWILDSLVSLLASSDPENVLNASGTLGILAESQRGRDWMLESRCISSMTDKVTSLLTSENMWTASNCALILARLTIGDDGCKYILEHKQSSLILRNLIDSLKIDTTGRGTNAAFALGRLYDQRKKYLVLIKLDHVEKMITTLSKMLICSDPGACKNACFALSCIFVKEWNQDIFLSSSNCPEILETLAKLLFSEDHETGWFAAVALHTIASIRLGCLQIRRHKTVEATLENALINEDDQDLVEEITSALTVIKRLEKPSPPRIRHVDTTWFEIEWDQVISKCGFIITYKICVDQSCVYQAANSCHCLIDSLKPATEYEIQLQVTAEEDESPLSDRVSIITAEGIPEAPKNLRLVAHTRNQVKLTWDSLPNCNSAVKYYLVQTEWEDQRCIKKQTVIENISIINGLLPATSYILQVAAVNTKGRGPFSSIQVNTSDKCNHIPPKPNVSVIGRNELHLTWLPPKDPLGRINHYEVFMDGAMVYSGNNMSFALKRLTPDTEYKFVVSALTNEGRFDSKPVKKKTAKDDFDIETTVSKSSTTLLRTKYFPQKQPKSNFAPIRCKSAYNIKKSRPKFKVSTSASLQNKRATFEKHHNHSASQFMHWMHNQKYNTKTTNNITRSLGKSSTLLTPSQINICLHGNEVNTVDSKYSVETSESCDSNKTTVLKKTPINSTLENRPHTTGEIIRPYQSTPNKENIIDNYEMPWLSKKLLTSVWNVPQNIRNKLPKKSNSNKRTEQLHLSKPLTSNTYHTCRKVHNSHRRLDTKLCLELRIPRDEPDFNEKSSVCKENDQQNNSICTITSEVDRSTLNIAKSLYSLKLNENKQIPERTTTRLSPTVGTTRKFCSKEINKTKIIPTVNMDNQSSDVNNQNTKSFGNHEKHQKSKNIAQKNKCPHSYTISKHLAKSVMTLTSSFGKSKMTRMCGKSSNSHFPQSNGSVNENKTPPATVSSSHKIEHRRNATKSDLTSSIPVEKDVNSTHKQSFTERAKSSYLKLNTITLTSDISEYRHKSAGHGEGFIPSQIRAQPSNLNLRQLERFHTTLSEMKDDRSNSNLQKLIYKKIQDMLPASLSVDPSPPVNMTSLMTGSKQLRQSKFINTLFGKQIQLNGIKLLSKSSKMKTDSLVLCKS